MKVTRATQGRHPTAIEMEGPVDAVAEEFMEFARDMYGVRYAASVTDRDGEVSHARARRVPPRYRGAIRVVRLQARHVEPGDAIRVAGEWVEVLAVESGTQPVGRFSGNPPVTVTYLRGNSTDAVVLNAGEVVAVQDVA